MYVVKVGEYYVKSYNSWDNIIALSQEIMRGFDKEEASHLAKKVNGEVIKIKEEVTNE
jgi:hypothetical protein